MTTPAIEIKDSTVLLTALDPRLLLLVLVMVPVWEEFGFEVIRVTSASEPWTKHAWTSLHYDGRALDFHSQSLGTVEQRRQAAELVNQRLGPDVDFILEGEGTPNEHFHGEVQPKRRAGVAG